MTDPPLPKRGKWVRGGNRPDPCRFLPEEVLCRMTSCLDARSLLNLGAVNHYYQTVCRKNAAGWDQLCTSVWKDKIHVCPQALQTLQQQNTDETAALRAYRTAKEDAAQRQCIRLEEFCYDLNPAAVWSFRFKESAGADWTSADPWYQGLPCREMVFLSDGKVKTFIAEDDTEETTTTLYGRPVRQGSLVEPLIAMSWRFLTRPMDLPRRSPGSYVRFAAMGRDVPTYSVRRSPNQNWGFVMESCWGLYASFPLPPRKRPRLLRRTAAGTAAWVREEDDDEDSESLHQEVESHGDRVSLERNQNSPRTIQDDPLQDDSELLITNEIQWREAFLYNVGARELPEGDQATDEFDRAWGGT